MRLLDNAALEQSGVVANCRMNRERGVTGSNSYAADLGFNPLRLLTEKAESQGPVRWLDLCCGSGRALIEAVHALQSDGTAACFEIVGVDLVGLFLRPKHELPFLRLVEASLSLWEPDWPFDLITCVHGLHYIGDKLSLIKRAVSWLTDDGRFAANLDLSNFRFDDGRPAGRSIVAELRRNSFTYQARKKLLNCAGRRSMRYPFKYLGADDNAGPNYTGQPAVDSFYCR